MTKMRLGVIDYIDSAHYLPGHGKCGRVHGHTYKIEVLVEGEVRENGMVIDFYDLKKGIKETLKEYDHILLNEIIEFPSSNTSASIFTPASWRGSAFRLRSGSGKGKENGAKWTISRNE